MKREFKYTVIQSAPADDSEYIEIPDGSPIMMIESLKARLEAGDPMVKANMFIEDAGQAFNESISGARYAIMILPMVDQLTGRLTTASGMHYFKIIRLN